MLASFPPPSPLLHLGPYRSLPSFPSSRATPELVSKRRIFPHKIHCLNSIHIDKVATCGEFPQDPVPVSPPSASPRSSPADHGELARLLQSCSCGREVRRVHAVVVKTFGRSPVTFVGNNLISVYVRLGMLKHARRVFDEMLERNVVTWTAILDGYSEMGSDDGFLELLGEMVEHCVEANSFTYVCVLNFCCKTLDFKLGRQVHARIVKGDWGNLIVDGSLVCFYARCGELSVAFRLFDGMEKHDVVCWTTMITACARGGRGEEALSMFDRMQEYGFSPNEFTVCSVLKACGDEKALRFGRQLHGAIVKKVYKYDVFVGSSLVGMYVKCNSVEDARTVFDLMPSRNTVTWTSLIAGYVQNGQGEKAIKLFRRMKTHRILANSSTVVCILSACGIIGYLCLGKEVHGQILKNCIQENLHVGSTLIWFYCKCGHYAYAAKVLEAMPKKDVISWTAIISGHTNLGLGSEALGFLKKMLWEGIEPNPFTYSSSLKACAKIQATRQGQLIHASISKTRALPNVFVGSALISLYMKCGCTDDALRIFNTMPEHNLVSWKTMVVGYAKNGLCGEALKFMYQMQEEGLEVDDYVLSTVLSSCSDTQWESQHNSTYLMLK